jgi:hypothetical protein
MTAGTKAFQNVQVVAATGGEARAVSFLANANAGSLSWSPDGSYLTFATSQRTEPGEVMRVDLLPRTPKFREDQFRDLFREEQPKTTPAEPSPPAAPALPAPPAQAGAKRQVEIVYDETRRRAAAASGRRRGATGDQPGRQMAAADRERGRTAELPMCFRSTSCRRSQPSRAS